MIAAMKSRIECKASERMPRLPVTIARNTFRDTSTRAEPMEASAAIRFSREACSRISAMTRAIIRSRSSGESTYGNIGFSWVELTERRKRNEREATRLAMEAANFHLLEQERRRNYSTGDAALRRSERTEGRARKSAGCFMHIATPR